MIGTTMPYSWPLAGRLLALCTCLVWASAVQAEKADEPTRESAAGDPHRGEKLFAKQCASCHGNDGQGVEDHYPEPLGGDYPLAHLLQVITDTMPEEDPEACVDQNARDVAVYVYRRFYDPRSSRAAAVVPLELSRLTTEQLRQSVSALVAGFAADDDPAANVGGLSASYFKSRSLKSSHRVFERIDPVVDFDFGEHHPEPSEGFKDDEFGIRWSGGVKIEQTGQYAFHLKTENGAKLWVNDLERPLIDAGVRSGKITDRTESLFLIGGQTYPIQLDFFKRVEKNASISLAWTPPGGQREVMPSRHLVDGKFSFRFVPETAFPPDDRSEGYERGTTVSRAWAEAAIGVAIETAGEVVRRLDELAGWTSEMEEDQRREEAQAFAQRWAATVFRRPLDDDAQARFVDRHFSEQAEPAEAVKRVVIATLQSPRFLYPAIGDDQYAVASRLAYALWDAPPDEPLLQAAADGRLADEAELNEQARRMLGDPRAATKLHHFFSYWLRLDLESDLSKDTDVYPDFDRRLAADLQTSLQLLLQQTLWGDDPDFRRLLLAETIPMNRRVAEFLGVPWPETGQQADEQAEHEATSEQQRSKESDNGEHKAEDGERSEQQAAMPNGPTKRADDSFIPLALPDEPRAGVLTHPFMMAVHAHRSSGSPIHRGVFITRGILGRVLRSPPDAIELVDESLHPEMTNRQRVEMQTKPANCQSCHSIINPLGFALEHFDGVGRYQGYEKGQPIDASGIFTGLDGRQVKFEHGRQLAQALAESEETSRSFVARMYEYLAKAPIATAGPELADQLWQDFVDSDFNMRRLAVRIAVAASRPQ